MSKTITTKQATEVARAVVQRRANVAHSYGLRSTEHMVEEAIEPHGYTVGLSFVDADDERTIGALTKWIVRNAKPATA